jgi:hypothetical protein
VTTVTGALEAQGIRVLTARPVPATLEDVFIALITRGADQGKRDADLADHGRRDADHADRGASQQGDEAERHS